jgi:hypothetical protein
MDEMQMKKKEVVTVNAWLANEIKDLAGITAGKRYYNRETGYWNLREPPDLIFHTHDANRRST